MRTSIIVAAAMTGTSIVSLATPAQAQTISYDIPAGDLKTALDNYGKQSGRPLLYRADDVRGATSRGYRGLASPEQALRAILVGTGFGIHTGESGSMAIVRAGNGHVVPAASPGPGAGSADIVVTAQRYEQRLQDVPMSVSAFSGDDLRARNVQQLKDMEYAVPGLSTFEYGVGQQYLQLRGVANTFGASTVGSYFDETPLALDAQGAEFQLKLIDMERVEVLRGPQATLYGQGSMGGTIRYIPAAPQLDTVSGSAEGQWSSTKGGANNYEGNAAINLPIVTDKVGLRIAGGYERIGGYIDQVSTGDKNINSADTWQVRATLRIKPTERFDVSLLGLYQKASQAAQNFGIDDRTTAVIKTPARDRTWLAEGKAAYDLDFATLSGSASYVDRRLSTINDITPFYLPTIQAYLGLFGFPPGYVDTIGQSSDVRFRIFNSELRLASQGGGPLHWAVGATYRDLRTHTDVTTITTPNPLPFTLSTTDLPQKNRSFAVYGEVGYDLTHKLEATAGLRYYNEHKSQIATSDQLGLPTPTVDVNSGTFDTVNPRFNLSYAFTRNSMVYASVAKGFRSGGFNISSSGGGVIPVPPTYDPDQIWTYEVGTKHQLFGNRLILDASVYRSVWSKVQSYLFAPGSTLIIVTNSGRVAGWGADLSATARPARDLTLIATYGWNDLAYKRASADKLPGDPVDGAVRTSWSASLDYRPALTDRVNGVFRIDYQHAGKSQLTFRNFAATPIIPRPGRDLVNARIGVDVGPVEVSLFVNNLFDERNPSLIGPFGVYLENILQQPRVIGLSASTRF